MYRWVDENDQDPRLRDKQQFYGGNFTLPDEEALFTPEPEPPTEKEQPRQQGGPTTTMGGLLAPWTGTFSGGQRQLPSTPSYTAPTFTPPTYKAPDPFQGPSFEQAMNEPGYRFSVGEGQRAIEQAAAAKGALNTGGTLKDLLNYGQSAGAQNYQNVWNRDLGTYNTNVQTQNVQPYQFAYQGAMDAFAPQMAGFNANVGAGNLAYSTTAAWNQRANEMDWNRYLQSYDEYRNQKLDTAGIYQGYLGL